MSDIKYSSVEYHAAQIAGNASAAYWDDSREAFHRDRMMPHIHALADLLGLMLVPKPDTLTALPEQPGEWIDEVIK